MIRTRRALLLAGLALALGAGFPPAVHAHSIVRVIDGELSYQSLDATSLNSLEVVPTGGEVRIRDPTVDGGIDPGPCRPGEVTDDANAWIIEVFCPASSVRRARVDVGEREDSARFSIAFPLTLLGGPGRTGSPPARARTAPAVATATTRSPGLAATTRWTAVPAADSLDGGPGDDRIGARDGFVDQVTCGPGADAVGADGFDDVAADCESVDRATVAPAGDSHG